MRVFLDSSALAKKYIAEKGSERILALWQEAEDISLSILCVPEVLTACNRLRREKKLNQKEYQAIKGDFFRDVEDANLINVVPTIIEGAVNCLEGGTMRTLDAIHVASAMSIGSELFVTSDPRQAEGARAMKLQTELV
ncbi:MAG: type II toxin-antitoxin system VapC family toxin [Spirochaetia bacterium]|jgi:predicted nucleic acid-binding protein